VADVFISYSQKTPEAAAALAESLKAKGYDVWWDMRLNAGDRFDDVIREQLDDADAVIVIWSAESVRSKYVTMEAGMALGWSKLIPVRAADLPLAEVPAAFQRLQTCDAADIESIDRALQTKGLRPQQAGRRKALSREELISELGRVDQSLPASVGTWLRRRQQVPAVKRDPDRVEHRAQSERQKADDPGGTEGKSLGQLFELFAPVGSSLERCRCHIGRCKE
jgi:hypothetical protein